jgi:hypothetical protein
MTAVARVSRMIPTLSPSFTEEREELILFVLSRLNESCEVALNSIAPSSPEREVLLSVVGIIWSKHTAVVSKSNQQIRKYN